MEQLPLPNPKLLADFLAHIPGALVHNARELSVTNVTDSSRACAADSLFIALVGSTADGHAYIEDAISHGAKAILCQTLPETLHDKVMYITVSDTHALRVPLAQWFFEYKPSQIKLIGVTGTNGKTSVATFTVGALRNLGMETGLLSTIEYQLGKYQLPSVNTTPGIFSMYHFIYVLAQQGIQWCVLECSSHALHQGRLDGLMFHAAIFTNLTQDHLDYHKTMGDYAAAKKLLFDRLSDDAFAIVRKDDQYAEFMIRDCNAITVTYSVHDMSATYTAHNVTCQLGRTELVVNETTYSVPATGVFQAENILSVISLLELIGIPKEHAAQALSQVPAPQGRLELIAQYSNDRAVCIDYAHTPDALSQSIASLRQVESDRPLWVLVGCGGDRDTTKRPIMGGIAATDADHAILTSDNPRTEDPQAILTMVVAGVPDSHKEKITVILDRREAIEYALKELPEHGVLLLAGKGHETYQIIGKDELPFDETKIVTDWINRYDTREEHAD